MRESSVQKTPQSRVLVIREDFLSICDNDLKASVLLSILTYWHDVKIEMREKNKQLNDIAERHGENREQDETLLQFHTEKEIAEMSFGILNKKTVRSAKQFLIEKGFISIHRNPNPRYSFDNTTFFQLIPEEVNIALSKRQKLPHEGAKIAARGGKNDPNNTKDYSTDYSKEDITGKNPTVFTDSENSPVEDFSFTAPPVTSTCSPAEIQKALRVKSFDKVPLSVQEFTQQVILKLNKSAGTNFRHKTMLTIELVARLLSEGYSQKDIFSVIENKCAEWKDHNTYQKYLRPSTLFGKKFDEYLHTVKQNAPKKQHIQGAKRSPLSTVYGKKHSRQARYLDEEKRRLTEAVI